MWPNHQLYIYIRRNEDNQLSYYIGKKVKMETGILADITIDSGGEYCASRILQRMLEIRYHLFTGQSAKNQNGKMESLPISQLEVG